MLQGSAQRSEEDLRACFQGTTGGPNEAPLFLDTTEAADSGIGGEQLLGSLWTLHWVNNVQNPSGQKKRPWGDMVLFRHLPTTSAHCSSQMRLDYLWSRPVQKRTNPGISKLLKEHFLHSYHSFLPLGFSGDGILKCQMNNKSSPAPSAGLYSRIGQTARHLPINGFLSTPLSGFERVAGHSAFFAFFGVADACP